MTMTPVSGASPTAARRIVGALRLVAALALAFALSFQIVEKALNNDLVPIEYFSFFTVETSIIAIVLLLVGGVLALGVVFDPIGYTTLRMCLLAYEVVTSVVYNVMLRGLPDEGFVASAWPGEIMHVWIPIFLVLDWLFSPGRPALGWTGLRIVVIFPIAWLAYTMVRGAVTGWYPYPFLEPSTGVVSVLAYVLGITVFVLTLASLAIAYSRWRRTTSAAAA
jgi:hypothetical protein